jgi:hypothetical protein
VNSLPTFRCTWRVLPHELRTQNDTNKTVRIRPNVSLAQIRQIFSKRAKCEFGPNPPTFLEICQLSQNPPSASLAQFCQLFLKPGDLLHGVDRTSLHNNNIFITSLFQGGEIKEGEKRPRRNLCQLKKISGREQEGHPP